MLLSEKLNISVKTRLCTIITSVKRARIKQKRVYNLSTIPPEKLVLQQHLDRKEPNVRV
jgi:hypothetical protein